jgi:hypothetical protein
VLGFVSCALVALTMFGGAWAEPPFEAGNWTVELGADVRPGAVGVAEQLRSMKRVAGATAALVSLLSLMSLAGLMRQRARLRRPADRVHWSVGATRRDFAARWIGEGWRTGALAGLLSLCAGLTLPGILAATFPGTADAPPSLFWTALLLVLLGCGLLHRSMGAGSRAARAVDGGWGHFLSLPATVAAPAFASLVLVGLLRADGGGPTGPDTVDAADRIAPARLHDLSPEARGAALVDWVGLIDGVVGVASRGSVRGAGREVTVWVECGMCSLGGLPLPVRTVRAELHALAPDTFAHLGLEILEGRDFRMDEAGQEITAAVVSRSLAVRHFQDGRAVGRRIRFGEGEWIEVVGVVEDRWDIRDPDEFAVYLPLLQARPDVVELFEGGGRRGLDPVLTQAPAGVDVGPLDAVQASFASGRWFQALLSALALLALGIAVAGVWVGARSEMRGRIQELALRRAVGATPGQLWRYWVGFILRHLGAALGVGAWLAVALASEVERSFGMPPVLDSRIWTLAALPLVVAFVAGALPPFLAARQAAPASRLGTMG